MRIRFSGERMNEAHFIGQLAQLRHQLGHHLAGLPARLKLPRALGEVALIALKGLQSFCAGHGLTVPFEQFRFEIKCVQMTARARAEDHEYLFRLCREMSVPRGKWFGRINLRPDRSIVRQRPFPRQQAGQGNPTQPLAGVAEKLSAIKKRVHGTNKASLAQSPRKLVTSMVEMVQNVASSNIW